MLRKKKTENDLLPIKDQPNRKQKALYNTLVKKIQQYVSNRIQFHLLFCSIFPNLYGDHTYLSPKCAFPPNCPMIAPGLYLFSKTATALTGEPVPPRILSGNPINRNLPLPNSL